MADASPVITARVPARALWYVALLPVLFLMGCNQEPMFATNATDVEVTPSFYLLDTVNDSVQFTAVAFDASGHILAAPFLVWRSSHLDVATINANRGLAKSHGAGQTTIRATVGSVSGTATLEVYLSPYDGVTFVPGETYFGRNNYIEYVAGDLPVIISVPHDGQLAPDELPDLPAASRPNETGVAALARTVATTIHTVTGRYPHLVVSHLDRAKIELNDTSDEGTQNNPPTRRAWRDYHGFLLRARDAVASEFGGGLYIDLHGQDHVTARVELGYLIPGADLMRSDMELNQGLYFTTSSIRGLVISTGLAFAELLRGDESFGGLLAQAGFNVVPSPALPDPASTPYGSGGYGIYVYGSGGGGTVSGIEVQLPVTGVLDTEGDRDAFADALVNVVGTFLAAYFQFDWSP
jgi:hypothetical protein